MYFSLSLKHQKGYNSFVVLEQFTIMSKEKLPEQFSKVQVDETTIKIDTVQTLSNNLVQKLLSKNLRTAQ